MESEEAESIVSLSMAVGLRPECIRLEPMDSASSLSMLKVAEAPGEPYRTKPAKAAELEKARKQLEKRK